MLGVCCMWVEQRKCGFVNAIPHRNLQLGRLPTYSEATIRKTYISNLVSVQQLLRVALKNDVRFVRISSALFPLWDKVPREFWDNEETGAILRTIGAFVLDNGMRVNMHPSQYVVLSSDKQSVVEAAIAELNFNGLVFDRMGLPRTAYYNINIHGGKGGRADVLPAAVERLDECARSRLTFENCEFSYTVQELVEVSKKTGVPVVVDVHHHALNDGGLSVRDALDLGRGTWGSIKPTTHLSNSKHDRGPPSKRRIHSDFITEFQADLLELHDNEVVDVEVEAKAKNLAVAQLMRQVEPSLR